MQKVQQSVWGATGLPSYVNMFVYVPDALAKKPPILVASHHCQGSATSTYNETRSTFVTLADRNGFIIIFPEATGRNCWDVGSTRSLSHDGGGDTHAIAQMVRYALGKYGADASRVYAFGASSGAMMTQALMGIYPDVFVAGVAVSGVACGCWAVNYSGDAGSNGQWSGPCAGGQVTKTPEQWGDLVRGTFPGYAGHRPRLQLWHGTADSTIRFANLAESIKEWTNVLGLDETPDASDTRFGATHQLWKSACGHGVLETFAVSGASHDVRWDSSTAVSFLGLDQVGGRDPEAVACSGSGGTSGTGGTSSTGGAAGSGGTPGPDGDAAASGGATSVGGGRPGTGGASGGSSGGNTASGGANATGGSGPSGGSAGISIGSIPSGSGGAPASGGASQSPATGGSSSNTETDDAGCGCYLGVRAGRSGSRWAAALLIATLGLWVRRRRFVLREHFELEVPPRAL